MTTDRVLLLSPRVNDTGLQLITAARRRGLHARTATAWRTPEELLGTRAHIYGGPLFGDAVGRDLGLALLQPPPGWLATLPYELTRRHVELTTLAEARKLRRPAFVKPPGDKLFPARIYPDGSGLPGPDALDDTTTVQVGDVVRFRREYRLFVLDGTVRTGSRYLLDGELDQAPLADDPYRAEVAAFAAEVLAASAGRLPSAVVVDVGLLDDGPSDGPGYGTGSGTGAGRGGAGAESWAVVEANTAWASGGYACDPDQVLEVVLRAAAPADGLAEADRPFCRRLPEIRR